MRRFTIIFVFSVYIFINAYAEMPLDFFIRSEYKRDTIDYNDSERYYYRERLAVIFSQESALNLSYIYLEQEKDNKYTWNLVLEDISPETAFIIGNYFTQFGTGLLIGQKRTYDPDIFSIRIGNRLNTEYRQIFKPCNTGNPVFAFNGLAGTVYWQIQEIKFSINSFYSINERFIDETSYDSGEISGTLETIDNKIDDKYNHNEPLGIYTGGVMLSADIFKNILFQVYYLNADIHSLYKEEILWEYDESGGISRLNGFGIFSQYKDDFLNFFIDGTMTQKEAVADNGTKKNECGYGLLYGIGFSPPFFAMSIAAKEVQSSFYSPYSSSIGGDYPESAWFFDTVIKPYTNLRLLTKLSSQKKTSPSSTDNELPIIKKENISLIYSYNFLEELDVTIRKISKIEEANDEKKQIHSSINIKITDYLKVKLSGTFQQNNYANSSGIFDAGIRLSLLGYFQITIDYLTAHISKNNPVYAVISPVKDSSTHGFFIKQDSDIIVIKSDIRHNKIYLSCRYLYQYYQNKSLYKRIEFYGSGYF